ncbi:ATP-binding protein [Paenibacillus sp. WLX1005]|uniref:sensor histidine kinase n=1 Tax=Paenibacillus sp. WLX1005 TaxID=3243766 RepID=UPI003983F982
MPDISTTSREGMTKDDERVELLIDLLKVIVGKLIRERISIANTIRDEETKLMEYRAEVERQKRILEEQAKEKEKRAREEAEVISHKLDSENRDLKDKNNSLKTENKIKDVLLSKNDHERQTLLVHELTGISNQINYVIADMAEEFYEADEYERISSYLTDLKKGADKLSVIKKQFLKLNDYDIIGKHNIDLKKYLISYFDSLSLQRTDKRIEISDEPYLAKVEVFELGVLLDNLVSNAIERNASYIKVIFNNDINEIHFFSDTGPIKVDPIQDIFRLGFSNKRNGTGIGMYLIQEICKDFGWEISIGSYKQKEVDFVLKLGEI